MTEIYRYEPRKRGLELIDEKILSCPSCGRQLLHIMKVKENDEKRHEIVAICSKCGDETFKYKNCGEILMDAISGQIVDIESDFDKVDSCNIIKQRVKISE